MRSGCIAACLVSLVLATAVEAQWPWQRGFRTRPRFPAADSFDGRFNFCRLMYENTRREAGGQGWSTDYPSADINFSIRLSELTRIRVSVGEHGRPNHFVVQPRDPLMFQCPWMLASDVGTASFAEDEAEHLRAYLLKGGFLWVDDFWGSRAWEHWAREIAKVLPPGEFPIADVPRDHPILRTMFDVEHVPQIPSIQFWRQSGGLTSERGSDSATAHLRAITDRDGRIMVLMTHNTDISDAWEREGEDPAFFYAFSPGGYALGIDVMMYAMTH